MVRLTLIEKFGHYYWYEAHTRQIVISDESADCYSPMGKLKIGDPWETEDGILLLDFDRLEEPITQRSPEDYYCREHSCRIPVKDPTGFRMYLTAISGEYNYACLLTKWLKNDPEGFFNALVEGKSALLYV